MLRGGVERRWAIAVLVSTVLVASVAVTGVAGAGNSGGKKTLTVIGAYDTAGESRFGVPNLDDGARLAVADLERKGWTVRYERTPASPVVALQTEAAFATAVASKPDFFVGLSSSNVVLPLGAKIAAADLPTFALASPPEGVRTGVAGGDNLYLLRPLDEQLYGALADYACGSLRLRRLGLSIVDSSSGARARRAVEQAVKDHPKCEVVTVQTNPEFVFDVTPQVTAFRDAGVDGIISANAPGVTAAQVNQLRGSGNTVPYLGGSNLNFAKVSNAIRTDLENVVVIEDCMPGLARSKAARTFTEAYRSTYGYTPNQASAQVYDAFHLAANAVEEAGSHDPAKINKVMATARYRGVCDYGNDGANVLGKSATIYGYHADGTRRLLEQVRLAPVADAQSPTPT